jgi:hypothetical protein
MDVQIDASQLLLTAKRFRGAPIGVRQAIREGLNQGGDKTATDVRKALWKQTGAKAYRIILQHTRTIRAVEGAGDYHYTIVASGKGLPLTDFRAIVRGGSGGAVIGYPWGVAHRFQRSFSLDGSVAGARVRTTSKRFPIRRIYGPSIAKEAMQGAVPSVFLLSAQAQVPPIILARLARVLGAK